MTLRSVGAWCGSSSLASPERDVALAVEVGLDRLCVVVNDHSRWRDPTPFTLRDEDKIATLCAVARSAGLTVDLMSWVMPHEVYIREAARRLLPLMRECQAGLEWDGEEPWTKARRPMPYPEAAALIAEVFTAPAADSCDPAALGPGDRSWAMGANGIGYTPVDKFGPLAEVCDWITCQAYSTSTSGVSPDRVDRLVHRWADKFRHPGLRAGLACYRQEGIEGFGELNAITTAARSVIAAGMTHLTYWSLDEIRRDSGARAGVMAVCAMRGQEAVA